VHGAAVIAVFIIRPPKPGTVTAPRIGCFFPNAKSNRILNRNRFIFYLRNAAVPASFAELWRVLAKLDNRSLAEILQPRRVFQILRGQFQNCLVPLGDTPVEETWLQEYGIVEEFVSKNTATQS